MSQILVYIIIIFTGAFLAKKKLIPNSIKKRLGLMQTISLFILLGTMGYKIGIDDSILANFHIIGKQSVILAVCTAGFSVLFTFICFSGFKFLTKKQGDNK